MARSDDLLTTFALRLGAYAKDPEPEPDFVIPEDLSVLTDEELTALHEQAVEHFDTLFNDGQALSDEDVAALAVLTEGIETLLAEMDTRGAAQAERDTAAAELAARAHPTDASDPGIEPEPEAEGEEGDGAVAPGDPEEGEGGGDGEPAEEGADASAPQPVAASARKEIRVSLGGLHSRAGRQAVPRPASQAQGIRDVIIASGDGTGFPSGTGLDWDDVGKIVDRRLAGYNHASYEAAAERGDHIHQQSSVAVLRKPIPEDLMITSGDPEHVDSVLRRAMDESRLPGGSLVASGGWCAPSETRYELCELESRDGLLSVPEIGISRGGIKWTPGPDFATIYNNTGFCYTEADDIAGKYGPGTPATTGSKPCYTVACPPFQEARLDLCGLCVKAGLLMQRGYPEVIARTTRGALVAHDHQMSARMINAMVAGSTAVSMPAGQIGAVAPVLTAIELQVEHYRYAQRLSRNTTLEAVFPFWVHGVIRSDLSRRLGTDLDPLSVSDAQIDAWFRQRGVNAQFVYDWQDFAGVAATAFTKWPASVKFLLYAAGTWVRGTADVITVDTLFDSVLLGTNDFTALFTEEGVLAAKLCTDSRVVTVEVCGDGATAAGVLIGCDGATSAT